MRREMWHGRGNFAGLGTALCSRVALVTLAFAALHLVALAALVTGRPLVAAAAAGAAGLLCLASAAAKYGAALPTLAVNGLLYYAYFWGRALALISTLVVPRSRPR